MRVSDQGGWYYVKAYVRRGKIDAVDAAVICEAVGRLSKLNHLSEIQRPPQPDVACKPPACNDS